jgi:hypothetical protein
MTQLMEQAIRQLQALPASEQDRLAQFLIDELKEDERWAASTEAHANKLDGLIADILAEDARGETTPLDPDAL